MLFWGVGLSLAIADDVVVFGDSWAQGSGEDLGRVFIERGAGLTVDNRGVGGTTAGFWAAQPNALPDAVSENPDARWVWLSIGGNDVFAYYAAGEGANADERIDTDVRIMLDALFSRHPDVRVVLFGYDFVNFEQSTECISQAFLIFGPTTTPAVNQIFFDQVGAVHQAIADDYPNVTYVSLWGTLQLADGVPGAPNVLLPSPGKYFADCIHPTHEGYRIIHRALYDRYWGLPAPVAAIDGPAEVCVGDDVQWADTSTGADRRRWTLDGADAGDAAQISIPTEAPGVATLSLRVDSPAWEDVAALTVTINDCTPDEEEVEETDEPDSNQEDLDDTGQDLDVSDGVTPAAEASGCSTVSGGGWAWLAVLTASIRRRRGRAGRRPTG